MQRRLIGGQMLGQRLPRLTLVQTYVDYVTFFEEDYFARVGTGAVTLAQA